MFKLKSLYKLTCLLKHLLIWCKMDLCFVQTTINDIQQQMNDHYQKNTTLREENMELTTRLKGLIEQYELREQVSQQSCGFLCSLFICNIRILVTE